MIELLLISMFTQCEHQSYKQNKLVNYESEFNSF